VSPPGRESRPAVNGAALDQPGGPRPTLQPDPREPVEPAETTMDDVIARALTLVVVPGGKARRRSLPDEYRDLARELLIAVEALEHLHADARFPRNLRAIQRRDLPVVVNHAAAKLFDLRDVLASDGSGVAP